MGRCTIASSWGISFGPSSGRDSAWGSSFGVCIKFAIVSADRSCSIQDSELLAYLDYSGYAVDIKDVGYILEVEIMSEILGNIEISRGDSYPLKLTINSRETKLPLDLTGYEVKLTVNADSDPEDITNQICQIQGVVDPDQINNKGVVVFTPNSLDTALVGTFYYDIQLKAGSMVRSINENNTWTVKQDKTKN